jgi:hypothetical protein
MVELLEVERRVAECNARTERQRRVIEELRDRAHDVTSAQIVFDSLCVSLSLCLRDRHRLRELREGTAGQNLERIARFEKPHAATTADSLFKRPIFKKTRAIARILYRGPGQARLPFPSGCEGMARQGALP